MKIQEGKYLARVLCWFNVGFMPVSCQTSPTAVNWKEAGEVEEKWEAEEEAETDLEQIEMLSFHLSDAVLSCLVVRLASYLECPY